MTIDDRHKSERIFYHTLAPHCSHKKADGGTDGADLLQGYFVMIRISDTE